MTTNPKKPGAANLINNSDENFSQEHPCAKACDDFLRALEQLKAEITRARGSDSASRLYGFIETIGLDKALITYKLDDDERTLTAAQRSKAAMARLRDLANTNPAFFDKNSPTGFTFPGEDSPRVIYLDHAKNKFYIPKQPDIATIIPGTDRQLQINIDPDLSGIFLYATGRHPIYNYRDNPYPDPIDEDDDRPRKSRRR